MLSVSRPFSKWLKYLTKSKNKKHNFATVPLPSLSSQCLQIWILDQKLHVIWRYKVFSKPITSLLRQQTSFLVFFEFNFKLALLKAGHDNFRFPFLAPFSKSRSEAFHNKVRVTKNADTIYQTTSVTSLNSCSLQVSLFYLFAPTTQRFRGSSPRQKS